MDSRKKNMLDDYLTDSKNELINKKKLLAAWYLACDTGQNRIVHLGTVSMIINSKQELTQLTNEVKNEHENELKDFEILLSKFQCNELLILQNPNKPTFQFYTNRILRDFIIRYPNWNKKEIKEKCMTTPKLFITKQQFDKVKLEIYKRQLCETCGKEPIQLCAICNMIYYCSSECQFLNWQKHKISCF